MIQKAYSNIFYARSKDKYDFNRHIVLFVWRRKIFNSYRQRCWWLLSFSGIWDGFWHKPCCQIPCNNQKLSCWEREDFHSDFAKLPSAGTYPLHFENLAIRSCNIWSQLLYFVKHNLTWFIDKNADGHFANTSSLMLETTAVPCIAKVDPPMGLSGGDIMLHMGKDSTIKWSACSW